MVKSLIILNNQNPNAPINASGDVELDKLRGEVHVLPGFLKQSDDSHFAELLF